MNRLAKIFVVLFYVSCSCPEEDGAVIADVSSFGKDAAASVDTTVADMNGQLGLCYVAEDGTPCDDENACTTGDECEDGHCIGATSVVCKSDSACVPTSCDPQTGCLIGETLPDGSACSLACHVEAYCEAGDCLPAQGSKVQCPKSENPCVDHLECDSANGQCTIQIFKPEGASCDTDVNTCTLETCDGNGLCAAQGKNDCAGLKAIDPCWAYQCLPGKGCVKQPGVFFFSLSCDDGSPCTINDECQLSEGGLGGCKGTPLKTNDGNPCTSDSCVAGEVLHEPINGAPCDDGNPCSVSVCEGKICVYYSPSDCTDGNPCTDDACSDTSGCVYFVNDGNPCDDGNPCTSDFCKQGVGCEAEVLVATPCEDGSLCSLEDFCFAGVCQPGAKSLGCTDGNPCTDDACQPAKGCVFTNNAKPCDDGSACTEGSFCKNGSCSGYAVLKTCLDNNSCTEDICTPLIPDCVFPTKTDGVPCGGDKICLSGVCL
ncbi:MAG: hypothetical protein HYY51_02895 [Candidatus Magasanikbacteria bacterium]|nr:hypothetical protein [Candidatus Magasanikbacteria bacterium]